MGRDKRRGEGQWRGCHAFKNIVCDDNSLRDHKRNGGLKMGHTYYYYYEVDGSTETHDPTMPSTTACPYLPGQTVNSLAVPVERTLRHRSASLSSMRQENYKTMNPSDKFITPLPVPATSEVHSRHMHSGSATILRHCASSRSLSPAPCWKRFFGRKTPSPEPHRGRSVAHVEEDEEDDYFSHMQNSRVASSASNYNTRTSTPTEGTRTRDISPESLRRFLCEDLPSRPSSTLAERPVLVIPDDIIEDIDDTDDDDNFATSAVSESQSYFTSLSPPPFQRSASSESISATILAANSSSLTLTPAGLSLQSLEKAIDAAQTSLTVSTAQTEANDENMWPISATSSTPGSPIPSHQPEDEAFSFYDSQDDDDMLSSNDGELFSYQPALNMKRLARTFEGYSLPRQTEDSKGSLTAHQAFSNANSPALIPRSNSDLPVSGTNFLGSHVDTGLDDFANDLSWIIDAIRQTNGN